MGPARRAHEGPPSGPNARLRGGMKVPRPRRERDRVTPVSTRHSASQFPLHPYRVPLFDGQERLFPKARALSHYVARSLQRFSACETPEFSFFQQPSQSSRPEFPLRAPLPPSLRLRLRRQCGHLTCRATCTSGSWTPRGRRSGMRSAPSGRARTTYGWAGSGITRGRNGPGMTAAGPSLRSPTPSGLRPATRK